MKEKYLLLSLEDDRTIELAKILGNKTCKKIIDFLADRNEASEKDIADGLKTPINTIEYNLKKLIKTEIIEKTKTFFWSQKGKKIPMYRVSNKSIVITPRKKLASKLKNILPVVLASGIVTSVIGMLTKIKNPENIEFATNVLKNEALPTFAAKAMADSTEAISTTATTNIFISQPFPIWGWFLAGAIFSILIYSIINWRKI
jgi:DNA-binding transcriptional ArsR family regulator